MKKKEENNVLFASRYLVNKQNIGKMSTVTVIWYTQGREADILVDQHCFLRDVILLYICPL